MVKKKKQPSMEVLMLLYGKDDEVFYTTKDDKHITALSTYYKRKVKTQRVYIIEYTLDVPITNAYVKVTLGEKY